MSNAKTIAHNHVTIRRAQEADRAVIEHISARSWNGTDYLPRMLSAWLNDPDGELYVATTEDGRVVGTGKLSKLGEGEWWLEGARVDPDLYGHGIGGMLHRFGVERAEAMGSGLIRFTTAADNVAIHKLAARTGFSAVAHFLHYMAKALPDQRGANEFRLLSAAEVPMIQAFLAVSAHLEQVQHSILAGAWQCYLITAERLSSWSADSRIYGWHGQRHNPAVLDGLLILGRVPVHGEDKPLDVAYLDATPGNLAVMAQAVRGLTAQLGCQKARYMLLNQPTRMVAIEQAGWRRPDDASCYLFSRPIGVMAQQVIDP